MHCGGLSGIRLRRPQAWERKCYLRLAAIKLGRERAVQLYLAAAGLSSREPPGARAREFVDASAP